MAAPQPARASPERRVAPLSPRYRRNYTTHRDATQPKTHGDVAGLKDGATFIVKGLQHL